jgi:hypothetical protein
MAADSLSEQQVWDVVVRWQGLRPLEHFYTAPNIRDAFARQTSDTGHHFTLSSERLDIESLACEVFNGPRIDFNITDRERFYLALTRHWLAVESLKMAGACFCHHQSDQNRIVESVGIIWMNHPGLQQSIDVLEVHDFIYGFLLRQTELMDSNTYREWFSGMPDRFDPLDTESEAMGDVWKAAANTFNPADVLEMIALTSRINSKQSTAWSPEEKWKYFQVRGYFCCGEVLIQDIETTPDFWFGREHVEWACQMQVRALRQDSDPAERWEQYRTAHWKTDSRGNFTLLPTPMLRRMIAD